MLESRITMQTPTLLLASNSPRRKQLLGLTGWGFRVAPADLDESVLINETPFNYVARLAEAKARAAANEAQDEQFVIGSDTTVVLEGEILAKPVDEAEAVWMLEKLRGRTHQVLTGICVLNLADDVAYTEVCVTDVPMRNFSDTEIKAYVATGDPMDKAGAYAIQHPQFKPVASMAGCFASVMGLPLCHVNKIMKRLGYHSPADVPAGCQQLLAYQCPVYHSILNG